MLCVRDPLPRGVLRTGVFLFPVAILVRPDVGEDLFRLLALVGCLCFLLGKQHAADWRAVKLLSLLVLGYVLVTLLAAIGELDNALVARRFEQSLYFLAAPFLAVLARRLEFSPGLLLASARFAALLVFVLALQQYLAGADRAGGEVNALVFGQLALLLGFFSLSRVPLESAATRVYSLLAFCAGTGAALLSQSRGAWVTALLLFPVLVLYWRYTGMLGKRGAWQSVAVFLLLVFAVGNTPLVQQRVDRAVNEYVACRHEGNCNSSVGLRLLMWKNGLLAAAQRPLRGWGLQRTQAVVATGLKDAAMSEKVLGYNHLHNEYINTLVAKGVPGLLSLLFLLLAPLVGYIRETRNAHERADAVGVLLCTGYLSGGVSNLAFGHDIMNAYFTFYIALTLPVMCASVWIPGVDSVTKARGDILRAPSP